MKEFVCDCCGTLVPEENLEVHNDNLTLCKSCFEEHYFYCNDCNELHLIDESYYIEDCCKWVCDNCICNYSYCEDCGNYFEYTRYIQDRDYCVCDNCYGDGGYFYCAGCDNYYSNDSYGDCDDYDDYCYDCWNENNSSELLSYHSFNSWYEYKGSSEEEAPYYIGKEIELEPNGYDSIYEVKELMDRYLRAVAMEDGSLNHGGLEVVTQPESWEFLQEHKEDYKNFFEGVEKLQYGNCGHCGLHFHITRPNENVISRIIVLLESFKDEIKKLSRRKEHQINQWSTFLTDYYNGDKTRKYQSTKYLKEKFLSQYHNRYMALNLTNSKTIEFRFFNGANNFEEFWGALQFIHNLMEIALEEDRDINSVNWSELMRGEELITQAIKTEVIDINKFALDTTEMYEKVIALEESTKQDIKKIMNNFIKYVNRELSNLSVDNKFEDFNELLIKTRDFSYEISTKYNYLSSLVNIYRDIDTNDIASTKTRLQITSNHDKYQRYFKQLDKIINNYESEVMLQCA